ncbi:hypothetical protein EVJ58_g7029 [Rhodofomes roseus]|uniref:Uncharacterized protein n=1 Tax=Rhodofomes roseus TaxID=34475 RepID=A0A4Y9Y993_9APHY|nr:hypothetical protein EVJ58_g7029 [Rhodofomes roseus]
MQTAAQEIYLEYSCQMSQAMYWYALLPMLDMFQTECNLVSIHKTFSMRLLDTDNIDALVAHFNTSMYQNLLHPHRVEVAISKEAFNFPANHDWHHPDKLPWVKLKPRELGVGEHTDAPQTHAVYTLIGQHWIEVSKKMLQLMMQMALMHMYHTPVIRHFLCSLTPILNALLPLYNDGSDPTKTRGFGRHYYDRCSLFAISSWRRVFVKGGGITLFAMMRMQWVMGVIGSKEDFYNIRDVEPICNKYDKARNATADWKTELAMYALTHDLDEADGVISAEVTRLADCLQREYMCGTQSPNYEIWTDKMPDTVDQFATDHLRDATSIGVCSAIEGRGHEQAYGFTVPGTRIGPVKVVFHLPDKITKYSTNGGPMPAPDEWAQHGPLAYVEWFAKLPACADPIHMMYSPSIPVPEDWNSNNILDKASRFLLNNWATKYGDQTLW